VDGDGSDGPPQAMSHIHDFAYVDGEIFALDRDGVAVVFNSATLEVVNIINIPLEMLNLITKIYGRRAAHHADADVDVEDYLHLVALPRKLLMVRTRGYLSQRASTCSL
jgi:hypothetical protein